MKCKTATVADLKLFKITDGVAAELEWRTAVLEKHLQKLIEKNMETVFGVRFVATEHSTGKVHRGRIDSLGLDENNSPVIFEYKRSTNENVINQGLFYLDWLVDHRGDFEKLVSQTLGGNISQQVDWSSPRLICVANDFTRYDEHAVRQIDRNVELVRYRDFDSGLLSIELISTTSSSSTASVSRAPQSAGESLGADERSAGGALVVNTVGPSRATVRELMESAPLVLISLYDKFETFALSLGDDVVKKENNNYFAFRRIKNFACVEVHPRSDNLLIYLKVNPDSVEQVSGFIRNVKQIRHFGTGDLELRVTADSPWGRVEELTRISYENS